ncbi:hypothetical protein BJ138DRAFT_1014114, partial [Hygrophoropsis aurantiaca]
EVSYIISILSAAEMKKAPSKRIVKNESFDLNDNEPWDTLKAQILQKISTTLNPQVLDFDDYDVTFYIPRILTKPGLSLTSSSHYTDGLMKRVAKMAAKNPSVNICVSQKDGSGGKENELVADPMPDLDKAKKRKESAAVLPGNERKVSNIKDLREEWICKKPDTACPSTHCYVDPATDNHHPLNSERFDCWASAMLKGDDAATLHKPPNHKLFDLSAVAPLSPVLQRRLDAQAAKTSAPIPAPVFNFTIGNEVLNLLRPPQLQPAAPAIANPNAPADILCLTLLPPSRDAGPDMPLEKFCTEYDLDQSVYEKFKANSFKNARSLRFVTISELKEMAFQIGEITELRDAVERWSTLRA